MKKNIRHTFIFTIFMVVVLISIWQLSAKAQAVTANQTPSGPTANSYIYLSLIMQPSCPPPANGARVQFGEVTTGNIVTATEIDAYYFCGIAGDIIRLDMSRTSGAINPEIDIYRPDGTLLCAESTLGSALSKECTLDVSGTYVILAGDRSINDTGGYSLSLTKLN